MSSPLLVAKTGKTATTSHKTETNSEGNEFCCPIVPIIVVDEVPKVKRTRQRKRPKSTAGIDGYKHCHRFFRPEYNRKGKALGYAWGYADSRPVTEIRSSYTRDRMKYGVATGQKVY